MAEPQRRTKSEVTPLSEQSEQLPTWVTAGVPLRQVLDSTQDAFYLIEKSGIAVGVLWINLEQLTSWTWHTLRRVKCTRWELTIYEYLWDRTIGDWVAGSWHLELDQVILTSVLSRSIDFLEDPPFTIEPLPPAEHYWAVCEFFPSSDNDGARPSTRRGQRGF